MMPLMYQKLHHLPILCRIASLSLFVYGPPIPMTGFQVILPTRIPQTETFLLPVPGGSSHLSSDNLKYGIQQYKPCTCRQSYWVWEHCKPNWLRHQRPWCCRWCNWARGIIASQVQRWLPLCSKSTSVLIFCCYNLL